MKITVKYGGRRYGNNSNATQFNVTIKDIPGEFLNINFRFPKPVGGRGENWENQGRVEGVAFLLSEQEARGLAVAILCHLGEKGDPTTRL